MADIGMNTDAQQAESLAQEIMELTRNMLLVRMRFLEPAVMALGLEADPECTYATDGFAVRYGFLHVLRSYSIQRELVFHDYLHMILHLLFHHPFVGDNIDPYRWDLACDIAVEAVIDELELKEAESIRSNQHRRLIEQFRSRVPAMTAEKIYHYLGKEQLEDTQLASLRELVQSDEHDMWYRLSKEKQNEEAVSDPDRDDNDNESGDNGESGGQDKQNESDADTDGGNSEGEMQSEDKMQPLSDNSEASKQWKDISSRVITDLETESRRWAEKSGSLLRNIRERIRERQSYREFLEQFMTLGEVMKVTDEEFDYIYYTYGLKLYDNVPLVEPLEYADEKRISELAIVIDTSASVDGEQVMQFIEHTLDILADTDSFFTKTELRVILCDSDVKGDYRIQNREEAQALKDVLVLRGFGGTDFRPAFRYIDRLADDGEFNELRGVLYFTDGYGRFPE